MSYSNLAHYKEQSVYTMTKGELLVLLYDELIKRMNKAKFCIETCEFGVFSHEISRCMEIVNYLILSLDNSYSLSSNLRSLYNFLNAQLASISASRKIEPLDELLPIITDLRDTWKEADKLSNKCVHR